MEFFKNSLNNLTRNLMETTHGINGDHTGDISSSPEPKRPRLASPRSHSAQKDYGSGDSEMDSDDNKKDSSFRTKKKELKAALGSEKYGTALSLLEEDVPFPIDHFEKINKRKKDGKLLIKFLQDRLNLHRLILLDDEQKITKMLDKKSKVYLNLEQQSALYTAAVNKKFKAYSVLKRNGAKFKSNEERRRALSKLNHEERIKLENIDFCFFEGVEKSHLKILVAKSKVSGFPSSSDPDKSFEKVVMGYYEELDKIPEISIILKVVNLADNLDIVYDFESTNTCGISTANEDKFNYGVTKSAEGRVYIGAKREKNKVLGVIAHELTHMAMEIVYENHCFPYLSTDEENKHNYHVILDRLKSKLKIDTSDEHDTLKECLVDGVKKIVHICDTPEQIFADGLNCDTEETKLSETIVRVSQVLTEIKNGRDWLKDNAAELYEYYQKVISDCSYLVEDGSVFRVKRKIKSLNNEIQGKLNKLALFGNSPFKNIEEKFYKFLNTKNNYIFILKAKNATLSILKTLRVLHGETSIKTCNEYLVFDALNFIMNFDTISNILMTAVVKSLTIEVIKCNHYRLNDLVVERISMIRQNIRPTLKIIIVVKENENNIQTKLRLRNHNYKEYLMKSR